MKKRKKGGETGREVKKGKEMGEIKKKLERDRERG